MKKLSIAALILALVVGFSLAGYADKIQYNFSMDAVDANVDVANIGHNNFAAFNDISLNEGFADIYQQGNKNVTFANKLRMDEGTLLIDQYAVDNVTMQNDVRMDKGWMWLEQMINPNYGQLDNKVLLAGSNIKFLNVASENWIAGDHTWVDGDKIWVPGHRAIQFAQDFYVDAKNDLKGYYAWVDSHLASYGNYIDQELLMWSYGKYHAAVDAWDGELGTGQGQFGQLANKYLPEEVGGKGFITADFRVKAAPTELEWTWINYPYYGYYQTVADSEILLRNSSNVGGYSEQVVEIEPESFDWVTVDNFSVQWSEDWE